MKDLLDEGYLWIINDSINRVQCLDGEIRMKNKWNHNQKKMSKIRRREKKVLRSKGDKLNLSKSIMVNCIIITLTNL